MADLTLTQLAELMRPAEPRLIMHLALAGAFFAGMLAMAGLMTWWLDDLERGLAYDAHEPRNTDRD
jgi:hypothetical protein